uniref:C-X-C motif chemokine ligand 13 n=1 Tax=Jaculus jaculus TaxID=51337 RepID=A0A8C5NZU5_JACJA
MRLSSAALLLLLVSSLPPTRGILETNYTDLKCKCLRTTSVMIPLSFVERIEVIPPGNGCPNKEVIIWTKNKSAICLSPQAKWVQKVIRRLRSKMVSSTPPAPVSKKKSS